MNNRKMIMTALVAAALIICASSTAHADPISILILGFIGIEATATAIGITTFVLSMAASIGLSYLARALAPKPSQPDISSLPGGTTGKLQSGGAVPRAFIVGRGMTAGSLAYANTYSPTAAQTAGGYLGSSTAAAGNTPNAYLVQVIALSDIPVTGLVGMFVGSAAVTYNPATAPTLEGIPIPEYNKAGKDYLWIRFYNGAQVAADPQLVALFGTDPDRPYTSARIGTGVAYAVVTALVNQDLFSGFPQCKFVLDGIKLYDRRYDSSAGGSGSQRWATPSTWALTANNIVIIENILRGISYGGKWVYGAQTVAAAQLPSASWMAAASECDSAVALAAGGTEPQFKAGGEIRFDVEPANTIEELLKGCNGRLAEVGGVYKTRAGAAGSAVFSFTDGDILSTEQQTFDPFPSLGQTINAVTAKYISPAEGWVPKDAPPLYDAALEAADGGRRQPVDISYSFVTSGTQVQRLMRSERDSHRAMRIHALPMPPEAHVLEPLDVVSWTSTRNGYSSKLFEVVTGDDLPNLNMGLALKEIDPNAYDWVAATDEQPVVDGTIVVIRPPPQPIVDWSAVPWVITSDGAQSKPGIKLGWEPNTTDVDGIRFEIRIKATAEVVHRGETDSVASGSIIISQNLIFNTAYQARGQYRSTSVRDVLWSNWLDVTTPDVRMLVAALDAALNAHITTQLAEAMALLRDAESLIASNSAEQDAANWLDKKYARSAISAQFGSAYAAIISEEALRVAGDSALAVSINSVNAAVNNVSAGTLLRAIASAGVDGALATVDLQVSASVGAVFATAGLQLAALVDAAGNAYSRVRLYGDKTEIGVPGVAGGDYVAPFAPQPVNLVNRMSLVPDCIPDGVLIPRMMSAGMTGPVTEVTFSDVARTYTQWHNAGAGATVIDATINTQAGSALMIDLSTAVDTTPGGTTAPQVQVKVNGSVIRTFYLPNTAGVLPLTIRIVAHDLPGGSTYVQVLYMQTADAASNITMVAPQLIMQELVRPQVIVSSGVAVTPAIAYRTAVVASAPTTPGDGYTYNTFSGVDIGAASDNRTVVVALAYRSPSSVVPSMTIGGVAATRVNGSYNSSAGYALHFFSLRVTAGTTADIAVVMPATATNIVIATWRMITFSPNALSSGISGYYGSTLNVLVQAGLNNLMAAFAFGDPASSGFTTTYTGSSGPSDALTEQVDTTTGGSPNARYAAYTSGPLLNVETCTLAFSPSVASGFVAGHVLF